VGKVKRDRLSVEPDQQESLTPWRLLPADTCLASAAKRFQLLKQFLAQIQPLYERVAIDVLIRASDLSPQFREV
jgi:hypothetical protein